MKVQGTSVDRLKFLEKLTYAIKNNNNIYANHHCVKLQKKIAFRAVGWMSAYVTAKMNGKQVPSCLNPVTEGKRIGFNFAYSFYKIRKIQNKDRKKLISEEGKEFLLWEKYFGCVPHRKLNPTQ